MNSAVYEGFVRHRRHYPVKNSFKYRIFFMYLDLAELPDLFEPFRFWSVEKLNLATFKRKDYLGDPNVPLDRAVRDLVEERIGRRPEGPIRILTHLRYFGYCFNPVSFYYCYGDGDGRLECIVSEINNTPWLERYAYVLDDKSNLHPSEEWRRFRLKKNFHVSPFMGMDIDYEWSFRVPGETLEVHIINRRKGLHLFDASLTLNRRKIEVDSLARVLLHYPPMTAKVTAMIYWQALKLRLKGAPFFTHPAKRPEKFEEVST